MIEAFFYGPVLHLDRRKLVFRHYVHASDSIDESFDCREIHFHIVIYSRIEKLLFCTDGGLHTVKPGMSQFVHRVIVIRHVYFVVSRDRCHEYLVCLLIYCDQHVDIAAALFINCAVYVYTRDNKVERIMPDISNRVFILYRSVA